MLSCILTFVYILKSINVYESISSAMYRTCNILSEDMKIEDSKDIDEIDSIFKKQIDVSNKELLDVKGQIDGINVGDSICMDDNKDIILKCTYNVNMPLSIISKVFNIQQRMVVRGFNGNHKEYSKKKFVYVTKAGSVYHTDIECTYLVVNKNKVLLSDVEDYRNAGGNKYIECKECRDMESNKQYVYITKYGTSYHNNPMCYTINRTVIPIEVSEIKGRKMCEKCKI